MWLNRALNATGGEGGGSKKGCSISSNTWDRGPHCICQYPIISWAARLCGFQNAEPDCIALLEPYLSRLLWVNHGKESQLGLQLWRGPEHASEAA